MVHLRVCVLDKSEDICLEMTVADALMLILSHSHFIFKNMELFGRNKENFFLVIIGQRPPMGPITWRYHTNYWILIHLPPHQKLEKQ